jgi:hypothetical protein
MSANFPPALDGNDRLSLLVRIAEDACRSATAQYDDYYRSFVGLDGKAQAAGTVAGVVVGALVAFVNATRLSQLLSREGSGCLHALLFASTLGALATVILSVLAMRVRDAVMPFAAEDQIAEAEDLAALSEATIPPDRVFRYYGGRLNHSKVALQDMSDHIESKARWVLATQIALSFTLASLLVLFLLIVYTPLPTPT